MNKRTFLRSLIGLTGLGLAGRATASQTGGHERADKQGASPLLVQECPLAGFQFHRGLEVWERMQPGDRLALMRAPQNEYDAKAVEVWWHGYMLGYIPRVANLAVSQMMDRGEPLYAVIATLADSFNPWERVQLEVWHGPPPQTRQTA